MYSDVICSYKFSTTHLCVTGRERVNTSTDILLIYYCALYRKHSEANASDPEEDKIDVISRRLAF